MKGQLLVAFAILALVYVATAQFDYCNPRIETDIKSWDPCNASKLGKWKSVSKCYYATPNKRYVFRYDYYNCVKQTFGSNTYYILTPGNCTGAQAPVVAADGFFDVFNRYNEATKTCNLTPPPPPTMDPSTSGMESSAGDTTTTTTTTTEAPVGGA